MRRGGPLVHVSHRYIYIYTRARGHFCLSTGGLWAKKIYMYIASSARIRYAREACILIQGDGGEKRLVSYR